MKQDERHAQPERDPARLGRGLYRRERLHAPGQLPVVPATLSLGLDGETAEDPGSAHPATRAWRQRDTPDLDVVLENPLEIRKPQDNRFPERHGGKHAHPAQAASWGEILTKNILRLPGVQRVNADQCQFGAEDIRGNKVRKPTGLMSNSAALCEELSKRCSRRGGDGYLA